MLCNLGILVYPLLVIPMLLSTFLFADPSAPTTGVGTVFPLGLYFFIIASSLAAQDLEPTTPSCYLATAVPITHHLCSRTIRRQFDTHLWLALGCDSYPHFASVVRHSSAHCDIRTKRGEHRKHRASVANVAWMSETAGNVGWAMKWYGWLSTADIDSIRAQRELCSHISWVL